MDDDGIPGGRITVTADQLALLADPTVRRTVASLVPVAVLLGDPAELGEEGSGLWCWDDPRLTPDDIALVLWLLDNPATLDLLVGDAPEEGPL
jgi:hypothetical protein